MLSEAKYSTGANQSLAARRPTGAGQSGAAKRPSAARPVSHQNARPEKPATQTRPATAQRRRDLFEEAAAIIESEYCFRVSLDDVARRVATSRRQLQRAFAESGETSFRAYLQKTRMDHAAELLRDERTPVNVVASAVGYRQAAQFAKAFRRHHGAPPSSFRGTAPAPVAVARPLAA